MLRGNRLDNSKCAPRIARIAAVLCACASTLCFGQIDVGIHIPIRITPPLRGLLPTETENRDPWLRELAHPGATYIAVHFAHLDLGPGEYLILSDSHGGQSHILKGKGRMEAGTFWARRIIGDTLRIELVTEGRKTRGVFVIDEYVAGYGQLDTQSTQRAICGLDDKSNAVCLKASHPAEYQHSQAVARLLTNGSQLCTGWLASSNDHLVTSGHCILTAEDALNTDFEFLAEAPACDSQNCPLCFTGKVFSGAELIRHSADLDYSLVRITAGNPSATYGFLEIDNRTADVGAQIYLPQHPEGRAKEIAFFSSEPEDADGVCTVSSVREPPCTGGAYDDIGYLADTEAGSSGSPVLSTSNHKVIALHHCAGCPNRGVPIHLIYPEIMAFIVSSGMQITPANDFESWGPVRGPYNPREIVYVLRNLSVTEIDYALFTDLSWLSIESSQGRIPGGGVAEVTISINVDADSLPVGSHSGIISFTNVTDGQGDTTREASLTVGTRRVVRKWMLDVDPGWTTEGAWTFGSPSGSGGEFGGSDPEGGHTGSSVYGYNLDGDYDNNLSETYLTSEAINCRRYRDVTLRFWRWLGVERPDFDHAFVDVSNDGESWTRLWENRVETSDTFWVQQEFDISAVADGQPTVYLRWTMGPTDSAWRYCGWNIDDIRLLAVVRTPGHFRRWRTAD